MVGDKQVRQIEDGSRAGLVVTARPFTNNIMDEMPRGVIQKPKAKPKVKRAPKPKLTAAQQHEKRVAAYMKVYFPQTTIIPEMRVNNVFDYMTTIHSNTTLRDYIRYAMNDRYIGGDEMDGWKPGRVIQNSEYVIIQGHMRREVKEADGYRFRAIRPANGGAWCVQAGCRFLTFHHWLKRAQGSCLRSEQFSPSRESEPRYQEVTMDVIDKLMDLCMAYDMRSGKFPKFE